MPRRCAPAWRATASPAATAEAAALHEPEGGARARQDLVRADTATAAGTRRRAIDARSGRALGSGPSSCGGACRAAPRSAALITSASTDNLALALQDVRYAADAPGVASGIAITNASTPVRNKWLELDYAGLAAPMRQVRRRAADAVRRHGDRPRRPEPAARARPQGDRLQRAGEDVIPPAGNVHYHERVVAAMGGHDEAQRFMRMYLLPGAAHSSQGRAYTRAAATTTRCRCRSCRATPTRRPTREQDQFFSALVDWVEKGTAPERDHRSARATTASSYPLCVYPKQTTWDGQRARRGRRAATAASSRSRESA